MSRTFSGLLNPPLDLVRKISDGTPENPFYTPEYLEVRKKLGAEACSLTLVSDDRPMIGCLAFLTRGKFNARLEITSLPVLDHDEDVFWKGLFAFCREYNISVVSAHTFASAETSITFSDRRISHKKRSEYRLDLRVPDLWKAMNRRTHRLVNRATAAGLNIRKTVNPGARQKHIELANVSLDRRRGYGDLIDSAIEIDDVNALLDCGAGELIQAVIGDEVHSTMLVARSRNGAYAQSSGTSDEGRELGASHFIFYRIACLLKDEGCSVFNLGGADEHSKGLQEFKLGLGSEKIELESAEFFTGTALQKFAAAAARMLRKRGYSLA